MTFILLKKNRIYIHNSNNNIDRFCNCIKIMFFFTIHYLNYLHIMIRIIIYKLEMDIIKINYLYNAIKNN